MSTYNRQINIAKIVSQAGVDAETAAEILSTDPEWAAEIVAAYDADAAKTRACLREETPEQRTAQIADEHAAAKDRSAWLLEQEGIKA